MTDVYIYDSIRRIDTSVVHLLLERRFGDPIGKQKKTKDRRSARMINMIIEGEWTDRVSDRLPVAVAATDADHGETSHTLFSVFFRGF